LLDLSDPSIFGSTNNEFLDGYHGGERCHAKALLFILEHGSILEKYSDMENIKNDLKISNENLYIYQE